MSPPLEIQDGSIRVTSIVSCSPPSSYRY